MQKATYTQTATETEWARGCPQCKFGIVRADDLTGIVSFYLERLVQMLRGQCDFCTCRAGVAYKSCLLNHYQTMLDQARRNPLMQAAAKLGTHPDLENAIAKIDAIYAQSPEPTIHYEGSTP